MFKCRACNHASELIGFVRDVFQHCASNWDRECLVKELDFVSRIFRGSEDQRGRKLFWKCEEVMDKIKGGLAETTAAKLILVFFQGKCMCFIIGLYILTDLEIHIIFKNIHIFK